MGSSVVKDVLEFLLDRSIVDTFDSNVCCLSICILSVAADKLWSNCSMLLFLDKSLQNLNNANIFEHKKKYEVVPVHLYESFLP